MPPIARLHADSLPDSLPPDFELGESEALCNAHFTELSPSLEVLASELFGSEMGPPLVESLDFLTRSLFEDRIVEWPEVMERTSLSKRTLQRLMAEGAFPRRVELSNFRSGWRKSEIDRWIRTRPTSPVTLEHD